MKSVYVKTALKIQSKKFRTQK